MSPLGTVQTQSPTPLLDTIRAILGRPKDPQMMQAMEASTANMAAAAQQYGDMMKSLIPMLMAGQGGQAGGQVPLTRIFDPSVKSPFPVAGDTIPTAAGMAQATGFGQSADTGAPSFFGWLLGQGAKMAGASNPNGPVSMLGQTAQDMATGMDLKRRMGGQGGTASDPFGGGGKGDSGALTFQPDRLLQVYQAKEAIRTQREEAWRQTLKDVATLMRSGLDANIVAQEAYQRLATYHTDWDQREIDNMLKVAQMEEIARVNDQRHQEAVARNAETIRQHREDIRVRERGQDVQMGIAKDRQDNAAQQAALSRDNARRIAAAQKGNSLALVMNDDGTPRYSWDMLEKMQPQKGGLSDSDQRMIRTTMYSDVGGAAFQTNPDGTWTHSIDDLAKMPRLAPPAQVRADYDAVVKSLEVPLQRIAKTVAPGVLFTLNDITGQHVDMSAVLGKLPSVTVKDGPPEQQGLQSGSEFYYHTLELASKALENGYSFADVQAQVFARLKQYYGKEFDMAARGETVAPTN